MQRGREKAKETRKRRGEKKRGTSGPVRVYRERERENHEPCLKPDFFFFLQSRN